MAGTFRLRIVTLKSILFDGQVKSAYLFGDEGEYELLPFHKTLMGALPEGEVRIKDHESVPIKSGVVMFRDNECTIIAEGGAGAGKGIAWSQITSKDQQVVKDDAEGVVSDE